MKKDNFIISHMTKAEIPLAITWAKEEGWNPGLHDVECFFEIDPNGFFIGKLNNNPIVVGAAVRYDEYYAFCGLYIVKKEFGHLETAIMLFLTGGDKLSVITLAGAADVIFTQLVTREGKENFTDILLKKENNPRSRQELGKEINDILFINALKHMDPGDDEYISLDVEECAVGAILKAIANYNMLEGKNEKLIQAFLLWAKNNLDAKKYNTNGDPNWEEDKNL